MGTVQYKIMCSPFTRLHESHSLMFLQGRLLSFNICSLQLHYTALLFFQIIKSFNLEPLHQPCHCSNWKSFPKISERGRTNAWKILAGDSYSIRGISVVVSGDVYVNDAFGTAHRAHSFRTWNSRCNMMSNMLQAWSRQTCQKDSKGHTFFYWEDFNNFHRINPHHLWILVTWSSLMCWYFSRKFQKDGL